MDDLDSNFVLVGDVEEGLRPLGLHTTNLSDGEAKKALRPLDTSEQAL